MSTRTAHEEDKPWRWVIITLLFLGTLINYIDRQTVSVLAPVLQQNLGLTNLQYAWVGTWFLFTYSLSMWIWGAVFDRLGNRLGFAAAISWWSIAEIAHALASGRISLTVMRSFLGVGESGNWPGATRTIAAWFSAKQRALGMGIANTGAAMGSAVAPPIIVWLQLTYGWKAAFVITGLLGLVWLVAWWLLYPAKDKEQLGGATVAEKKPAVPWAVLMHRKEFWGIVLARFFGDPIWWLYLNWLPLYLHNVRGFSLKEIGLSAWMPFLAAGMGCLVGGWSSGYFISRGWTVNRARKTSIVIATLLMPAGMIAAFVDSSYEALGYMSITLFGFQFWVGNVQTLPSDFFPVSAVGSIAGFAGTAAGTGAMFFTLSTGWVVDHFSYTPVLIAAAILAPVATGALFALCGRVQVLELEGGAAHHCDGIGTADVH